MSRGQIVHTAEELIRIRHAAAVTAGVRDRIAELIRPGMTTFDLDQAAGEIIRSTGGKSAFLGYCGYPGNICISINEVVIHGIGRPDVIIGENDIVSIDVGVAIDGAIGDTARTVCLAKNPSDDVKRLLRGTEEALFEGISSARAGKRVSDISRAIEQTAKKHKLGIVRDFVGHGCGIKMHEPPEVPNYTGWGPGAQLVPGMVLCLEPMLTLGTHKVNIDRADKWTVRTADSSLSAHYEHMVLITDKEPEILTWQKTM